MYEHAYTFSFNNSICIRDPGKEMRKGASVLL